MPKKYKYLYERNNYLIDVKFMKSVRIMNYDIPRANISILREVNILSDEDYNRLLSWPKGDREKSIGLMIRENPNISNIIKSGILDMRRKLFESNSIKDEEVVRIANDAVYVMRGVPLKYTEFGKYTRFIHKDTYSLFARIGSLTFMFNSEFGDINLDVIGLGADQMELHAEYMLNFIGNLFYMMEFNSVSETMEYFMDFYNQYLSRELPMGYYRELNPNSLYTIRIKTGTNLTGDPPVLYGISECNDVNCLEIGYNANILRELYGFIMDIHDRSL